MIFIIQGMAWPTRSLIFDIYQHQATIFADILKVSFKNLYATKRQKIIQLQNILHQFTFLTNSFFRILTWYFHIVLFYQGLALGLILVKIPTNCSTAWLIVFIMFDRKWRFVLGIWILAGWICLGHDYTGKRIQRMIEPIPATSK